MDDHEMHSQLTKRDLEHFRELLLAKRADLVGDILGLQDETANADDGALSHLPRHLGDVSSDTDQQDVLRRLTENDRDLLAEIDEALRRMEDGTYGVCEATDRPIPRGRLEIEPWTRYSIEAQREVERSRTREAG